jgi:hypothetical protein
MRGEAASADAVAAEAFVKLQLIIEKRSYSPKNKFSTSMGLLFSGNRYLSGLTSLQRKNLHPDLRLQRTYLPCV